MPWVALTGTPATGKTTVAARLREQGHFVLDIAQWAREQGLVVDRDEARGSDVIDEEALADAWEDAFPPCADVRFVEGHLGHFVPTDVTIVLRVEPRVLEARLRARGYHEEKVRENVEAEWMGVITQEALEGTAAVFELDATRLSVEEAAAEVMRIARTGPSDLEAPHIDWMPGEAPSWI